MTDIQLSKTLSYILRHHPEYLYQETARRFCDQILKEGLKPMGRNYFHLSKNVEKD